MPVFDIIAVLPLIPGQVVELQEQATGPTLAGFPAAAGVVMSLLQLPPFGREEPLEHVLPVDGGLRLDCSSYQGVIKGHKGELGPAPAGEICQDGFVESWKSVRVGEVLGHLVQVFIPHFVGSHGCAREDMGGGLGAATAGAMVIILVLPCEQGSVDAAIG